MQRSTKLNWLDTGLNILGQVGLEGLTIDGMAKKLGLTKGSFYYHFKSMADFELHLLEHWANQYLATAGQLPVNSRQRLALLDTLMGATFNQMTGSEVAIRMWAQQDQRAKHFVARVDSYRRQLLLEIFSSLIKEDDKAQLLTDMLFTLAIGSMTSIPRIPPERVNEMYQALKQFFEVGLEG
jgi:AcrR family transcriptional regulator